MISLGIDPGSRRIGYGVVEKNGSTLRMHEAGILPITSTNDADALLEAQRGIHKLIETFSPTVMTLEKIFLTRNQKTGIAVAQFRGVIFVAATQRNVRVCELTPSEVKMGITGYGNADKRAVAKMVRLILKTPNLRLVDDATDALALAIIGLNTRAQ